MNKTILGSLAVLVLLTSCSKEEDLQPLINQDAPSICYETCGDITSVKSYTYNNGVIDASVGVKTACSEGYFSLSFDTSNDNLDARNTFNLDKSFYGIDTAVENYMLSKGVYAGGSTCWDKSQITYY